MIFLKHGCFEAASSKKALRRLNSSEIWVATTASCTNSNIEEIALIWRIRIKCIHRKDRFEPEEIVSRNDEERKAELVY